MSATPGFAERGGWWVVVQGLLLAALAFAGPAVGTLTPGAALFAACLLLAGAVALGAWAALALGKALTPYPHPLEDAELCMRGPYGLVRHPIYSAVLLAAAGWALLWQSATAGVLVIALYVFFELKSQREERWLLEKDARYSQYRRQTKKFIPYLR